MPHTEMTTRVEHGRQDIPQRLHADCSKCIERARGKYNGFLTDKGKYYEDGFGVKCHFIPEDESFVDVRLKPQFTDEEWSEVNAYRSALLWGEKYLIDPDNGTPWRAYSYQRGPLLCKSPRKVYRFGRRCIPGHVPVLMADGSWRRMDSIRPGEVVASRNDKAQFVGKKVLDFWENGEKDVYRITLSNGMWVDCTENHPLLTYIERDRENHRGILKQWMSVEDGLQKGMKVCILGRFDRWGKESCEDLGALLGYLLTDGYIVGGLQPPKFTNNNRAMVEEVRSLSSRLFGYDCSIRPKGNGWDVYITDGDRGSNNKLSELLGQLGLLGLKSSNKVLPSWIYDWDKKSVMLLINRMFSGDGGIYYGQKKGRPEGEFAVELSLSSTSYEMLDVVRLLLMKIGVSSYIDKDGAPDQKKGYVQRWKLRIGARDSIRIFLEEVGPIYGKEKKCEELLSVLGRKTRRTRGTFKHQKFVSIKSIEKVGTEPTFDIEIEDTHNFVSNGICTHNTGKTTILAVEILWYLFTAGGGTVKDPATGKLRTNLKVLLLAPQKSHIENIFDRIRAFLASSPALGPCIDRNKRGSPQKITLVTESGISEGNAVTGFASGDSSGSKGLSARGQDADLIILDEGAFISAAAIEGVVLAILMTRVHTRFIISSTPSGIANDYFESICTKRPDFAEFYVPSTMHPNWDQMRDQMEAEYGSNQEQYDKELLAAFTPAGIGVYREDLVRLAQVDYEYGEMTPNPNFVYTFGVDWNKEHGTEIVIVGTLKAEPHTSYVVWSENIPKKENTSPRGIARIAELNQAWQPHWIYVDAGGGDGGQMLRYHGRSMVGRSLIDARLKDIVKDIDFGSRMEITEHDGQRVKVPTKPFMVENSVKKFELGSIKYPRGDLNIMRQLNNYIVARRTPAGVPVYGTNEDKWGDHTLDAMNLALLAVRMEFPSFQHANISPLAVPVAFIPNREAGEKAAQQRVILPAAANSAHAMRRKIPKPSVGKPTVVKYWGNEPPEQDAVVQNFMRAGIPGRKKPRYGR